METVSSNTITINVKKNLWDDGNLTKGSEAYKIFLYDVYYNLYDNLNRIKRLQLFSIQDFPEDALGNQWFTYKPKYSNCLTTKSDEENINDELGKDIYENIEGFKNPENIIKNSKSYAGELWVRLKNFPFAYPVQYVTSSTNETIWDELIDAEIYKSQVCENLGYVYYGDSSGKHIIFFSPNYEFKKEDFAFTTTNKLITRLDKSLTLITVDNEEKQAESVDAVKKTIQVNIVAKYDFKDNEFIDSVYYNSSFYLFYTHPNTLSEMTIKMKKISDEILIQSSYNLNIEGTNESVINLPSYTYGSSNICKPKSIANWAISISSDNINIAYEAEPYSI